MSEKSSMSSHLRTRSLHFQGLAASRSNRSVLLACWLFLAILALCTNYEYMRRSSEGTSNNSTSWPDCPIRARVDGCIHHSTNIADISRLCGRISLPVGKCQDRQYELIVADKYSMEQISKYTNMMVVLGSNIGGELDRFVQLNSRWMIDIMGGKEYELLTSVLDNERLALQNELDLLQHRCQNFFKGVNGSSGFGSNWHGFGLALAYSIQHRMTLYPISEYEYFIPVTTCTKGDLERAFADNPPETDILRLDDSTINFRSIGVDVQQLMMYSKIIKPEYHHKGHFWWRSMLTYYAIRPNSRLREVLRRSWNSMAPCMSIHVRHSDKWMEALPLDLGFYMKYAEIYRNRTGVSSIYLLTDDQFVIERTKTYTDFQFYYMDVPRSNKGWWFDRDQGVSMDIQERNFLIDIYTAAQCQHSILTYSSNVGRLIAELTFALRNTEPSVVSLDELWMMDP